MSLIPAALWPFCVALSWSVDWYTYFYIAVLYNFVFLEFCQWQSLGLHWKRGKQMWAMSLCRFGKAAIFWNLGVHILLCFTKFDKSVFFLLHYIFHVTTQNMESRKKRSKFCLWLAVAWDPSCHFWSPMLPLMFWNKHNVPFRVSILLNCKNTLQFE